MGGKGIRLYRLSNGVSVVTEKLEYLRTVSAGVWIKVGSSHETRENNGISHVIEHMLFKGTAGKSPRELADIISGLGDNVNAFTGKECTCVYGATLSEYSGTMLRLFADMLLNSVVDASELKKEKQVIFDEIDMYNDSPEDMVHELLQKQVWRDHPLGFIISGSKHNVRKLTRSEVLSFMKLHYIPKNIIISVAGVFDESEMLALLEELFGGGAFCRAGEYGVAPEASGQGADGGAEAPVYSRCFCSRTQDIEQLHMNIAFESLPAGSRERYMLSVLNSGLGGSNNSLLFQKIREELGLAYSVYSYGSAYGSAGLFHIDVNMNPSQACAVMECIHDILEELAEKGFSAEELERNKQQVRTELIMGGESAKSRMHANGTALLYGSGAETPEQKTDRINEVTAEDIRRFAGKYLRWENCSMCVIGNKRDNDFSKLRRFYRELSR